ncbi:murein biosynthesis integral membrane protein MurJ [Gulosibacter macacae]|uniref:Murein biosynthesis integral membrane protein MurJ n=1 Tax=Gulosibacter macacae TaxID=2488791 RepID=A0A3P3VWW3_9MICO|nr:lipid II flippase MurJ [Gulosibacter macacae]RRJ86528.1 murein biosynthesis integral membrane protein MurJ [Gulosibacter macacae]
MANSLGRTSLILASGTMVSRALGFVKAIVLAQTIGLVGSVSADGFANANSLPASIYALIAGGLLNAVLVPQIVRATKQEDGGQRYVNRLITLAIIVLGSITIIITVGAPFIAWLYGMTLSGEQLALVVAFAYWCLPQVFFYGLYAVVSEVLNARKVFAPFAWAPVLNNVIAIVGLMMFGWMFGADPTGERTIAEWSPVMIAVLGGMTTLGVVIQAGVLFLFLPKAGFPYRPDFHFRGTGLSKVGTLASWSLGVLVVVQITGWVETLATNLAFGQAASLAALQNAWMIFMLPHSIITVSLTTTMFTSLSERVADGDRTSVVRQFSEGARTITMFMVFSTVALMVISPAFARIFDSTDRGLEALALLLCGAMLSLLPYSLLYFLQRVFYAFEDTRSAFFLYLGTTPLQLLGIWLATMLLPVETLVLGLVLTQSLATLIRFFILFAVLRKRLGGIDGRELVRAGLRFAIAAVPTALIGLLIVWMLGAYGSGGWARSSILAALITCAAAGVAMLIAYFGLSAALRSPELETFARPLVSRFDKPRGRHSTVTNRHDARTANAEDFAEEFGSLVEETEVDMSSSVGATMSGTPMSELATAASQHTSELPSRRELRQQVAERRREEYLARHRADDEPLI